MTTFPSSETKQLLKTLVQSSVFFVTEGDIDGIRATVLCTFLAQDRTYAPVAVLATDALIERMTLDPEEPMPYSIKQGNPGTDPAVSPVKRGATINTMVPDGYYAVREAAALAGKSVDTLTRWRKQEVFVPSNYMEVGSLHIHLYSEDDIDALREVAGTMKPGRKPGRKPGQ